MRMMISSTDNLSPLRHLLLLFMLYFLPSISSSVPPAAPVQPDAFVVPTTVKAQKSAIIKAVNELDLTRFQALLPALLQNQTIPPSFYEGLLGRTCKKLRREHLSSIPLRSILTDLLQVPDLKRTPDDLTNDPLLLSLRHGDYYFIRALRGPPEIPVNHVVEVDFKGTKPGVMPFFLSLLEPARQETFFISSLRMLSAGMHVASLTGHMLLVLAASPAVRKEKIEEALQDPMLPAAHKASLEALFLVKSGNLPGFQSLGDKWTVNKNLVWRLFGAACAHGQPQILQYLVSKLDTSTPPIPSLTIKVSQLGSMSALQEECLALCYLHRQYSVVPMIWEWVKEARSLSGPFEDALKVTQCRPTSSPASYAQKVNEVMVPVDEVIAKLKADILPYSCMFVKLHRDQLFNLLKRPRPAHLAEPLRRKIWDVLLSTDYIQCPEKIIDEIEADHTVPVTLTADQVGGDEFDDDKLWQKVIIIFMFVATFAVMLAAAAYNAHLSHNDS